MFAKYLNFEYIKKIINRVKQLDLEVNDYKKVVQNPYIPSIAYVNWAIHLAEAGQIDAAQEKLISSTLMAHQTPEAYINLGILKVKERKFEEAIELYSKAIRLDKNNSKAFCFLANALTEMQNFKEAEKKFSSAAKLDPNNSDILMNWGISLTRQRKFLQAKEKFQQACKYNGANFTALYFLGLVDLELGDMYKAKEKFKMITTIVPNHYESFYYLAYICYKEKDYEKSLSYGLKSLEIFNKKSETYMLIAENYMHLKNEPECFKYYEAGEKECSINYFFLVSWGIALQTFEHYEESKEKFQKAIEIDDKNELAYAYIGTSFYNLKDYENALQNLNKAIEINPKNIYALDALGEIYFEKQDYNQAINYFSLVLKNSAKAVDCYGKIARTYRELGDTQNANTYYQKLVEYKSDEALAFIECAKFLIEQKDFDQALKKLQKAHKLDETNVECLNLLFYVNYILAKENISDYNMERAIHFARIIETNYPDAFVYKEEKQELDTKSKKEKVKREKQSE